MNTPQSSTVVVVGGGYAGTMAANRIAGHDGAQVILINPRPQFVHRIRLHQWATGTGDAAVDYGTVLGERVRLVVDAVTRIDVAAGRVELESGDALPYDHLVYAVGSTGVAPSTIPGAAEHGYLIGEWEAAQALRSRLEGTLPDAPTTVVGGGLTGIEMSAELGEAGRVVVDAQDPDPWLGLVRHAAPPGLNYYRLKLVFEGGKPVYSKTAGIRIKEEIRVLPNPTRGPLQIRVPDEKNSRIEVMDLTGRVVLYTTGRGLQEIDLSGQAAGLYLISVLSSSGHRIFKIQKE